MASSRNNTLEFSSGGSVILGDGDDSLLNNSFGAIQVLTDTTLGSTVVSSNVTGESLAGKTLPAGTILYGQFSRVTVSTGLVACHRV